MDSSIAPIAAGKSKRRSRITGFNFWKDKRDCPCEHGKHEPGRCSKCNCGSDETIWSMYGRASCDNRGVIFRRSLMRYDLD